MELPLKYIDRGQNVASILKETNNSLTFTKNVSGYCSFFYIFLIDKNIFCLFLINKNIFCRIIKTYFIIDSIKKRAVLCADIMLHKFIMLELEKKRVRADKRVQSRLLVVGSEKKNKYGNYSRKISSRCDNAKAGKHQKH